MINTEGSREGQRQRGSQAGHVFGSRDGDDTQPAKVWCRPLHVEQALVSAVGPQHIDQPDQWNIDSPANRPPIATP